ncbi:MAG TPA: hypothetical protein VLH08_15010, partial [Acidobacteriota bacterium]|nr:hypothetical protein [Acidobacteriota bacterium]
MKVLKFLPLLGLLLVLNSAYLAAFADPTVFYMANVLMHLGLGILVALLFVLFLVRNHSFFGLTGGIAAALLLSGFALGLILIFTGAYRPYRHLLQAHIAATTIGIILLAIHLYGRSRRPDATLAQRRFSRIFAALVVIGLILTVSWRYYDKQQTIAAGYINN